MRCTYGISAEVIAERTGVDVSTARRWKAGKTRVPEAARMILEADLGCFGRAWRGWKIRGEELVSPEGWTMPMGEVRALPLMRQQIATYQAQQRADREAERLAELPDAADVQTA